MTVDRMKEEAQAKLEVLKAEYNEIAQRAKEVEQAIRDVVGALNFIKEYSGPQLCRESSEEQE